MGKQKLELEIGQTGAAQTADAIKSVAAATQQAVEQTAQTADATKVAKEAQDDLNASTQDYAVLLSRLHPGLGAYAADIVKALKVAGDFAGQQITLSDVTNLASGAIGKFGSSLKLLGAGVVAYEGIKALVGTIQNIAEEANKAAEAIRAMEKAQRDFNKVGEEAAAAVASERMTESRKEPFTFEQEESVRLTIQAAKEQDRDKIETLAKSLGGAQGFGTAPGEFTGAELQSLANIGFEADPRMSVGAATRSARRALERGDSRITAINQAKADQEADRKARAFLEAMGKSTDDRDALGDLVGPIAKQYGLDPEKFRDVVAETMRQRVERMRRFPERERERMGREGVSGFGLDVQHRAFDPHLTFSPSDLPYVMEGGAERAAKSVQEVAALRDVFQEFLGELRTEIAGNAARTTNVYNNQRNYGTDAASQKRRRHVPQDAGRAVEPIAPR